jgi:predicted small lipoprotein YifL
VIGIFFNAEVAEDAQRNKAGEARKLHPRALRATSATSALSFHLSAAARMLVLLAILAPMAGCGTKTELLTPNGKRTPADQRDPSQPPSPLSR